METNSHTNILYTSSIDLMIENIPKLIYLGYLGYFYTAPDEFSTGWKFVPLGVLFIWNHNYLTTI